MLDEEQDVQLNVRVPASLHRRLRLQAVKEGRPLSSLVIELLGSPRLTDRVPGAKVAPVAEVRKAIRQTHPLPRVPGVKPASEIDGCVHLETFKDEEGVTTCSGCGAKRPRWAWVSPG